MNIGIVIHSRTGNTNSVAVLLKQQLEKSGHTVVLEKLEIEGVVQPRMKQVVFKSIPSHDAYDAIIMCSPVEAFSLAPVMKEYLKQTSDFEDKPVALLVTHAFPRPWLGGSQAIHQMANLAKIKGARILGSEIIDWSRSGREKQIENAVNHFGVLFETH